MPHLPKYEQWWVVGVLVPGVGGGAPLPAPAGTGGPRAPAQHAGQRGKEATQHEVDYLNSAQKTEAQEKARCASERNWKTILRKWGAETKQ